MPIVTMPDGTEVDMPENPPPEMLARLKMVIAKQHTLKSGKNELGDPAALPGETPQPKPQEDSALDTLKGVPGAMLTAASSIPAGLAGNVAGAASRIGGASMEDAGKRVQEVSQGLTYNPSDPAKAALEKASRVIQATKIEGLNPAMALPAMAPGMAAKAGGTIRDVASRAVRAISESPEAGAVKAGAGAVARAPQAMVLPEVRQLAQKATDLGIDIRPDMLSDNKFMRMMGEALEKVPLSGSKADQRQIAFNRGLMKQIGVDIRTDSAKRLTPDVFDKAITKSGKTIGDVSERTPINLAAEENGLDQSLTAFVANAEKFETSDAARIAGNYVKELRAKAENGVIPGETFRRINSRIGAQMRSTKDGDLKRVLSELQDTMQDALERQARPEDVPLLKEARKQYGIAKTIEPLVAKAPRGNISPAGLMGVATSDGFKKSMMARGKGGEVGDLAKIGQAFMKEPDSSGTTERAVAYGMLGGGAAVEPHTAAGIYAMANLYNRAGPAIAKKMIGAKKKRLTLQDMSEGVTE